MFRRLAIANGFGWQRFLKMVDQVRPKKGSTLELPLSSSDLEAAAQVIDYGSHGRGSRRVATIVS